MMAALATVPQGHAEKEVDAVGTAMVQTAQVS